MAHRDPAVDGQEYSQPADENADSDTQQIQVYLAGSVRDREDSGQTWRERLCERASWEGLNPLDKFHPNDDEDPTSAEIIASDESMIQDADAVLVYWRGENCVGTWMEVRAADREYDTPVVVVWESDESLSPWVEDHAVAVRASLERGRYALWSIFHGDVGEIQTVGRGVTEQDAEAELSGSETNCNYSRSEQSVPEKVDAVVELIGVSEDADATESDLSTGDEKAGALLSDVSDLITDDRDSHGDAIENQRHIGQAWTWYLRGQGMLAERGSSRGGDAANDDADLTGADVARMMMLLKLSRGCVGEQVLDHDRDAAGYAAIAGADLASREGQEEELVQYGGDE